MLATPVVDGAILLAVVAVTLVHVAELVALVVVAATPVPVAELVAPAVDATTLAAVSNTLPMVEMSTSIQRINHVTNVPASLPVVPVVDKD